MGQTIQSKSNKDANKLVGGCSKLTQKLEFQAFRKKMVKFLLRAF